MGYKISKLSLLKDMAVYNLMRKRKFSPRRHYIKESIRTNAIGVLASVENGDVKIRRRDVKVLARYANMFAAYNLDSILEKLQKYADFDVKAYAEKSSESLWQRMFPRKDTVKYQSSKSLVRKYEKYKRLCRKMRNTYREGLIDKAEKIRDDADMYAEAVVKGKITIKPKDYAETRNYFLVICYPKIVGSFADQAQQKMFDLMEREKAETTANISSGHSEKSSNRSSSKKRGYLTKLKVGALGLLAVTGSLLGVKSCQKSHASEDKSVIQKEIVYVPNKTADTVSNIAEWNIPTKKDKVVKAVEKKSNEVDSVQKTWNNYYDNTIVILSSAEKKNKLYSKIQSQLAKGVFDLPEGVSKERLAYTYVIYKAYGLKSSLDNALNSQSRISDALQQQLSTDIVAAGKKGEGVKKIAASYNGGKLSSYSKYDMASETVQKIHIQNLKKLRQGR